MVGDGAAVDEPGWRWDVALSFSGAQRDYVEKVAAALKARGVRCFYDAHEQVELWGKDLAKELPAVYAEQAAAVVVFISATYATGAWTQLEGRAAVERAVREHRVFVLPARFDDTELPDLPSSISAVDLRTQTPQGFADMVVRKLVTLGIVSQSTDTGTAGMSAGGHNAVEVVHQVVSYWTEARDSLLGVQGVGPVYSSMRHDDLTAWWPFLAKYVHQGVDQQDAPHGSLLYLTVETGGGRPVALLMRRVPALDPGESRINALTHALIGPADLLTPRQALCMARWPYWFGNGWGGKLRPASAQVDSRFVSRVVPAPLLAISDEERERFAAVAPSRRGAVARLLAETLRRPDNPFIIPGSLDEPDRILYTVHDILGPALDAIPGASWTFSTFENDELGPDGPRYLFVARRPKSAFESGRVSIDGISAPARVPDEFDYLADRLLRFYEKDGKDELAEFIAVAQAPHGIGEVPAWADQLWRRLAAYQAGDDLSLLHAALLNGTPLDQLASERAQPGCWDALPAQVDALHPDDFVKFLQRWRDVPSVSNGGTRPDAVVLVSGDPLLSDDIRRSLGRQALRAAFGFAHTRDGRRNMALDAAVECRMTPPEVFDQLGSWWATLARLDRRDADARLRLLAAALQASSNAVERGFATAADFDRHRAAAVAAEIVADVHRLTLVENLHHLAGDVALPLLLLTAIAEHLPAPAKFDDRQQIRDFLGRPDVAFLRKTLEQLPAGEQGGARSNLAAVAFGEDDLSDGTVVRQVVAWAGNGIMDDHMVVAVQDAAASASARWAVTALSLHFNNLYRMQLGYRQLPATVFPEPQPRRKKPAAHPPVLESKKPVPPTASWQHMLQPGQTTQPRQPQPEQQVPPDPLAPRPVRLWTGIASFFRRRRRLPRARMRREEGYEYPPAGTGVPSLIFALISFIAFAVVVLILVFMPPWALAQ